MSQPYRRIPFADFIRDAARIFDRIETGGETVLVERGGKMFVLSAWQAHRRRAPAKPQPPNMQDSLWSVGRSDASAEPGTDEDGEPNGGAGASVEPDPGRRLDGRRSSS